MRLPERRFNWNQYSVPEIASMLDDQYQMAWEQTRAWQVAFSTIDGYRCQLAVARADLIGAWPPQTSTAAAVYVNLIDILDQALAETADAAIINSRARSGILDTLLQAKDNVKPANDEWVNLMLLEVGNTSEDDSRRLDLNRVVHQLMNQTDEAIFQYARQLRPPSDYVPPTEMTHDQFTPVNDDTNSESPALADGSEQIHADNYLRNDASDARRRSDHRGAVPSVPSGGAPISIRAVPGLAAGLVGDFVARTLTSPRMANASTNDAVDDTRSAPGTSGGSGFSERISSSPSGETVEHGAMVAPGMAPTGRSTSRGRRRSRYKSAAPKPFTVPSLLLPRENEPTIHDPGLNVIGIDR